MILTSSLAMQKYSIEPTTRKYGKEHGFLSFTGKYKNHTHMWRRWGKTQDFFLTFINELFLEKLLKWTNEKQNKKNTYTVAFLKLASTIFHYF